MSIEILSQFELNSFEILVTTGTKDESYKLQVVATPFGLSIRKFLKIRLVFSD